MRQLDQPESTEIERLSTCIGGLRNAPLCFHKAFGRTYRIVLQFMLNSHLPRHPHSD